MEPAVVVGGGIVGASVAAHLCEAGVPAVLFERDALGGGTTAASVAMFVWEQADPDPTVHELRERSWATYDSLVEAGAAELSRVGGLYPARTDDRYDQYRAHAADLEDLGVRTRLLDAQDVERFGVDPAAVAGALFLPDEGYLDPAELLQGFVGEARAAGGRVETGRAVTDVLVEDGRAVGVEVDGERVDASCVVNAAGPWAPAVDAMAGVSLPLRHNRGPILVLDHGRETRVPFVEFEDGHYVRGEGRGRTFAGRYGEPYEAASRIDPDAARSVGESFRLDVLDRLERFLPGLADAEVVADWVGLRTITPDARPLVGETGLEGYHVTTGMSGLGVTLAPAVGRTLASTVAPDREPDPAVADCLDPTRFG